MSFPTAKNCRHQCARLQYRSPVRYLCPPFEITLLINGCTGRHTHTSSQYPLMSKTCSLRWLLRPAPLPGPNSSQSLRQALVPSSSPLSSHSTLFPAFTPSLTVPVWGMQPRALPSTLQLCIPAPSTCYCEQYVTQVNDQTSVDNENENKRKGYSCVLVSLFMLTVLYVHS